MGSIFIEDKEFLLYLDSRKIEYEVNRIAIEINHDLAGMEVFFLVILKGAFIFAADLLRRVNVPLKLSFIRTTSYKGMKTSGEVRTLMLPEDDLENGTVVIIEDILDTGLTLASILNRLGGSGTGQIKVATLFFKPDAYKMSIKPDYIGFNIPDRFVVGYGLDYKGYGRNLPDLYMYHGD